MSVKNEIEELLSRLTREEQRDLLEQLRERYAQERKDWREFLRTTYEENV